LDVTSDDDVAATGPLGPIDILVNNAGVAGYGNPVTMDFDAALAEMDINYFGALRMTGALAPQMIERGSGLIV
jgi:3-oxoacyl-[acyl-carrier protein] reductase